MGETFEDFLDESGNIVVQSEWTMIDFVDCNAAERGDLLAYRFIDYSRERDGEVHELTWAQFARRARAVAARLQQVTKPGERVAILAPQGLDYVVSLFAAVFAGNIAVPLFDPGEPGHIDRLHTVLRDCTPIAILTTAGSAAGVREFFAAYPAARRPRVIAVDAIPDSVAGQWARPDIDNESVAYLQYTSGSTRTPTGVEITHRSVGTNLLQMIDALDLQEGTTGVSWLPLFHDMGLLFVILPVVRAGSVTLMSPSAFVRRPYRWLWAMSAEANDGAAIFSAAPNFAFEHAALRGLPKGGDTLDLSNVIGIINGSEPVSPSSMKKFNDAFVAFGLPKTAIMPCYGMAEATLFVSSQRIQDEPKVIYVDRAELNAGRMVEVDADADSAVAQVSCGYMARSEWGAIVDPATGSELPDGDIGEIWLHGNNLGIGYWGRPEESEATFRNELLGRQPVSHAEGVAADGDWMRTGDLGAYHNGELFITGRVKDLVIIDGRNHYPLDLENTAQEASTGLRPGFVAAFSVAVDELPEEARDGSADAVGEQLVIVAERGSGAAKADPEPIVEAVRTAIARLHGLAVRDLLLVPAGSIPRTSSGKLARGACRTAYLEGSLRGSHRQQSFPDATD
ncbi:long-chain-fatty-acid--AMP ligase FadD32 [Nocardia aurantia]|uniref:long-chain-fatty-acid--AMP ligase FadD32 n=1 Tax=Nocardia aurantia TaxID=2585199 RepID=UPI0029E7F247|nr:long-chain-fatty-acid--AMP ligase FadD32 [Nocardia aurantia]